MRAAITDHLAVCTFANEGGDEVAGARADAALGAARSRNSSSSDGGSGRASSPSTTSDTVVAEDYEVVCPYASFGCV